MLRGLVETQEDERKRIARDLHDQLGQQLTALRLKLESLKTSYGAEPAMMKAIDETQKQAQQIVTRNIPLPADFLHCLAQLSRREGMNHKSAVPFGIFHYLPDALNRPDVAVAGEDDIGGLELKERRL